MTWSFLWTITDFITHTKCVLYWYPNAWVEKYKITKLWFGSGSLGGGNWNLSSGPWWLLAILFMAMCSQTTHYANIPGGKSNRSVYEQAVFISLMLMQEELLLTYSCLRFVDFWSFEMQKEEPGTHHSRNIYITKVLVVFNHVRDLSFFFNIELNLYIPLYKKCNIHFDYTESTLNEANPLTEPTANPLAVVKIASKSPGSQPLYLINWCIPEIHFF